MTAESGVVRGKAAVMKENGEMPKDPAVRTVGMTVDDVGMGRSVESELSVEHARRQAATLDADVRIDLETPLPLLWHWAFFAPAVPTTRLGHDGHPTLRSDGPTAGLPRRMWAGGRVSLDGTLLAGVPATRRSAVARAERKSGRSGDLLLVTVEHEITQRDRVVLNEVQQLIYRDAGTVTRYPEGDEMATAPEGGWADVVVMDPVRLFRFSALTFNSHRIHYDRTYANVEEGYPDLVVHGPLTALLLAESCRRRSYHARSFEFRASAPLFAGSPFTLSGEPSEGHVALNAVRTDGAVAMSAGAAW